MVLSGNVPDSISDSYAIILERLSHTGCRVIVDAAGDTLWNSLSYRPYLISPNLEELGRRLTNRGTEDKETINMRLRRALEEMELVDEYDYLVINDTIEQATEDILTIVDAEGMKCSRNKDIKKIFKGEM